MRNAINIAHENVCFLDNFKKNNMAAEDVNT